MREIFFDFNKNESIKELEQILCSSGRSGLFFSEGHKETPLFFRLLQERGIKAFEFDYIYKHKFSAEFMKEANAKIVRLPSRRTNDLPYNAVDVFSDYTVEFEKTELNALWLPELSAFLRCGDYTVESMLELFAKDESKRIILFPNHYEPIDSPLKAAGQFYVFARIASSKLISDCLEMLKNERFEAIRTASEKLGIKY